MLACVVVLSIGPAVGCSSSKSTASTAAANGLPTSTAGVGKNGSVDAKICAAIASDVAAVTKNLSTPSTFPGQCAFGEGATTVTFNVNDVDHSDVTNVISSSNSHTISGFGDGAMWYDGSGSIVPALGAWKGNVSCLVQPDSNPANDSFTYTGTPPLITITDADAIAYAQKEGAICNDVFAAAS